MDNPVLPPLDEIDWDKLEADFTPPEWDLLLSAAAKNDWLAVRHLVENEVGGEERSDRHADEDQRVAQVGRRHRHRRRVVDAEEEADGQARQ